MRLSMMESEQLRNVHETTRREWDPGIVSTVTTLPVHDLLMVAPHSITRPVEDTNEGKGRRKSYGALYVDWFW